VQIFQLVEVIGLYEKNAETFITHHGHYVTANFDTTPDECEMPGACGKHYKSYSTSRVWRFMIDFKLLYMNIARAHAKLKLHS
jgi:hypothetical protein